MVSEKNVLMNKSEANIIHHSTKLHTNILTVLAQTGCEESLHSLYIQTLQK